jgi:Tol biopolymer transport system component
MKRLSVYCISLLVLILAGCQAHFSDMSAQQKSTPINPPEKGFYYSPTWMSDNMIIFDYQASQNFPIPEDVVRPDLRSYDIEKRVWKKIPFIADENCHLINFIFLQRLPNQQLGFLNTCLTYDGTAIHTVREMDIATAEIKILMGPEFAINPSEFSFSPDMSEVIQEDATGHYLSDKLYLQQGDTSTQILPDFTRAMSPNWSSAYREIAFWGTENYSSDKSTGFKTLPEILGLSGYPFDLYISTPEGLNLKKVLSSVEDPGGIKWSPKEKFIAFSGKFSGVPGIWLVEPTTSEVTRIWPKSGSFDWSPDGSKLVILDEEIDKDGNILSLNISIIDIK